MSQDSHSGSPTVEVPIVAVPMSGGPVVGVAASYQPGDRIPRHRHREAQLIYAIRGTMTVRTSAGRWVVPTQRAVWVPPLEDHSIRMTGLVEMRTVYVCPEMAAGLSRRCAVVHVAPLLRELVLRIMKFAGAAIDRGAESRVVGVFVDEIAIARQMPLHLPIPIDPRLRRITSALRHEPGDPRTLGQWGEFAGASARTLARLFQREVGMTFAQWRQQARLLAALELLAQGQPVTTVALDLGYDSPSAFISMFRRALGVSPGKYFAPTAG